MMSLERSVELTKEISKNNSLFDELCDVDKADLLFWQVLLVNEELTNNHFAISTLLNSLKLTLQGCENQRKRITTLEERVKTLEAKLAKVVNSN